MVNRILVAGYYGFDNGGDELILFSLVNRLKKLKPNIRISVLSKQPAKTARDYGVNGVNRWNPFTILLAILRTDLLVFGGGGLLQDLTSRLSIYYYLGLIILSKLFLKKVFLISQGVGPIRMSFNRKVTGTILGLVDLITVRDELSKSELARLNRKLSVSVVPDLSFSLDRLALRKSLVSSLLSKREPAIGVSIQEFEKSESIEEKIGEICDELIRKIGSKIIFIPFHKVEDLRISRKIVTRRKNGYRLFFWKDVRSLLGVYDGIDLMLGMRLHSIVLACLFDKPFLAVSLSRSHPLYDPKLESFLELLGQRAIDIALPASQIASRAQEILVGRGEFAEEISTKVNELRESSLKNIEIFRGLL